jgi:hypothetical protein
MGAKSGSLMASVIVKMDLLLSTLMGTRLGTLTTIYIVKMVLLLNALMGLSSGTLTAKNSQNNNIKLPVVEGKQYKLTEV